MHCTHRPCLMVKTVDFGHGPTQVQEASWIKVVMQYFVRVANAKLQGSCPMALLVKNPSVDRGRV